MQPEPLVKASPFPAIEPVADDRHTKTHRGSRVYTQLMRTSGMRIERYAAAVLLRLNEFIIRHSLFPGLEIDTLTGSVFPIGGERKLNPTGAG